MQQQETVILAVDELELFPLPPVPAKAKPTVSVALDIPEGVELTLTINGVEVLLLGEDEP